MQSKGPAKYFEVRRSTQEACSGPARGSRGARPPTQKSRQYYHNLNIHTRALERRYRYRCARRGLQSRGVVLYQSRLATGRNETHQGACRATWVRMIGRVPRDVADLAVKSAAGTGSSRPTSRWDGKMGRWDEVRAVNQRVQEARSFGGRPATTGILEQLSAQAVGLSGFALRPMGEHSELAL